MIAIQSTEDLGLLIRATRRSQHSRMDDVAGSVGVGPVFVGDVERGKPTVQLGRVLQLLRELGIELYLEPPADVSTEMASLRKKALSRCGVAAPRKAALPLRDEPGTRRQYRWRNRRNTPRGRQLMGVRARRRLGERRDAFDLSPALPRKRPLIQDGASLRPVQWYFDNLLPEDQLRALIAREADAPVEDAFELLTILGRESAGCLTLRKPVDDRPLARALRPLSFTALSERIAGLPKASLSLDAPKRMSLGGAQHKLLVVYANGALFEPLPGTPSSHILKPDHPSDDYPASVANEYFTMTLAQQCGLNVPRVHRLYVPQPVYLVERFDRTVDDAAEGKISRRHAIDVCLLLNKPGLFKYTDASLESLKEAIEICRERARARTQIFRWVVFNALVGNSDNHLKNLSFLVDHRGIDLAPAYDLLSTAAYTTGALGEADRWPNVKLTLPLAGAATFRQITKKHLLAAGGTLGLARATAARIVEELTILIGERTDPLLETVSTQFMAAAKDSPDPDRAALHLQNEMRTLRTIRHVVIKEMLARIAA
jgi:serine/threonine-protein kinase HipA